MNQLLPFCQYSNLFGLPGQGFHKARIPILNIALWDTLGTLVLAFTTHYFYPFNTQQPWKSYLLHVFLWFSLATLFHWLFCVPTTLINKFETLLNKVFSPD